MFCEPCFYCARFRTEERPTQPKVTLDFTVRFFNRNTTTRTNYDCRLLHVFNFLFSLLRAVPVGRPALRTSENLLFARNPFVTTTQTLDFFDCDFHTIMYSIKEERRQQERRAAIPLSAKANSLLAA